MTANTASTAMTPTMPVTTASVAAWPASAALRPARKPMRQLVTPIMDGSCQALQRSENEL